MQEQYWEYISGKLLISGGHRKLVGVSRGTMEESLKSFNIGAKVLAKRNIPYVGHPDSNWRGSEKVVRVHPHDDILIDISEDHLDIFVPHVGDVSPVISKAGIAIGAKTITYCSDLVVFIKKYFKKFKFSIDLFFFIKEKRLHLLQIWSFSLKNRFWSDTDFSLRNIKKNYVLYKFSLYY